MPASTPETPRMTAEDAAYFTGGRWFDINGTLRDRILATYHALAEAEACIREQGCEIIAKRAALAASQQEVTRLRGLLDMTYSREDQDRLSAILSASPPPETTQGETR